MAKKVPWNKGKTGIFDGNKNPMFGRRFSKEEKEYISERTKIGMQNMSKEKRLEMIRKRAKSNKGLQHGFINGHILWNKKLTKEINIVVKNIGIKNSILMKEYMKTHKNHPLLESRKKTILPIKDTSIEIKIQNFLSQLQIEYFTHKYMNIAHSYQCDIFIPAKNLVIECDGNYWHSYPTGTELDNIRTKELIEKGFKVLRLWKIDIRKMGIEDFKNKLESVE